MAPVSGRVQNEEEGVEAVEEVEEEGDASNDEAEATNPDIVSSGATRATTEKIQRSASVNGLFWAVFPEGLLEGPQFG